MRAIAGAALAALAALATSARDARAERTVDALTADAHQRRAAIAIANGDHATASSEFLEAYWLTRNPNFLLGAAREAEAAGRRRDAAAYYFLYANLAPLDSTDAARLREKVTELRWASTSTPERTSTPTSTSEGTSPETPSTAPPAVPRPRIDPPRTPPRVPVLRGPRAPPVDTNGEPDTVETVRYGHYILLADGLSIALTAAGIESEGAALVALGVLGMLFAAPAVHAGSGNGTGHWLGAWGLRLAGMLIGASVLGSGPAGVFLGFACGTAVDAGVPRAEGGRARSIEPVDPAVAARHRVRLGILSGSPSGLRARQPSPRAASRAPSGLVYIMPIVRLGMAEG